MLETKRKNTITLLSSMPSYEKSALELDDVNFVIQINGKKRTVLKAKKDIKEKELLKLVKHYKLIDKYIETKTIKKVIFIENRLMNILIDE